MQAPLSIRRLDADRIGPPTECLTDNISLAGVYFQADEPEGFRVNDVVMASVAIPEAQRRAFPFTRLAGRGRVVRVHKLPDASASQRARIGVALEFGEDLTALTALPSRG